MKRRITILITVLALCLSLCPTWAMAANTSDNDEIYVEYLTENTTVGRSFFVTIEHRFDTHNFTYTVKDLNNDNKAISAIIVQREGKLYLGGSEGGKVESLTGVGVEVQNGGFLSVEGPVAVTGKTYGLDVSSGAEVQLSGGTFTGGKAAIRVADGNYAGLLAEGCAYFDAGGNPIPPTDVASAKTVVMKECTDHLYSYTHNSGAPTHDWACAACRAKSDNEPCTFSFDAEQTASSSGVDGTATCVCGKKLFITIDAGNLIYDGNDKTANVTSVNWGEDTTQTVLSENTDYNVSHTSRSDVGEITVTVTGVTYNGTFTKTYNVTQAQPVIVWNTTDITVPVYDGSPVEAAELPDVTITAPGNSNELSELIQYSYRAAGSDTDFTNGLPTNAGDYEIKASLPEQHNYKAAETDPCLKLTIKKKPADIITAPTATNLTYNREAQPLITAGKVESGAVLDGAVIEYATSSADGPYSRDIPTGINAGTYNVWYRVEDTDNYQGVTAKKVEHVEIRPKSITPTVEVSPPDAVFDGLVKNPQITVRDEETVLDSGQYTIGTWQFNGSDSDLTSAGTHTATITAGSNYRFPTNPAPTATFEIIPSTQGGLTITGRHSAVYYGDSIQLYAVGGTGDGEVKWTVSPDPSATDGTTIGESTGLLEVKGMGTFTVKAERTVENYDKVTDTWTFTVQPKPVTAQVTVDPKVYDEGIAVADDAMTATVKDSDLVNVGDSVIITGLTGTYDNANAGKNKTVTLGSFSPTVSGQNADRYSVSYPATATGEITPKNVTVTVTLSDDDFQTDGATQYFIYDGTAKKPAVTVTAEDGTALTTNDYTVGYSNNKNVGTASVTVRAKAGGNYTFDDGTATFEIRNAQAVLTKSPEARILTYTGTMQDLVMVGDARNGSVVYSSTENGTYSAEIPKEIGAGTYTVWYKVQGDSGYEDTDPRSMTVTINPKEITPDITLSPTTFSYDGNEKEPSVTVKDGTDVIDNSEFSVSYRNNTDAGQATVIVSDTNGGNYIVNGTATFTIERVPAKFSQNPSGKKNLPYNGTAQELVTAGSSDDGTVVYSLNDTGPYSTTIPTGTAVQNYTVWYKVLGDQNHNNSTPASTTASIVTNNVTDPTIELSSNTFTFNGSEQKPTVRVMDNSRKVIPADEYTVTYIGSTVNQGEYTITITSKGTNYSFDVQTCTVTILPADQAALTITNKPNSITFGDAPFTLSTSGGLGNGAVTWEITSGEDVAAVDEHSGQVTIKGSGSATVKATKSGTYDDEGNYKDAIATWPFTVDKKAVTVEVELESESSVYTGSAIEPTVTVTVGGTGITINDYEVSYTNNTDVGTASVTVAAKDGGNYAFESVTKNFTITQAVTEITAPTSKGPLTFNNSQQQPLVNAGSATFGTILYSLDNGAFSETIPIGINAGTYNVYYKVEGTANYTGAIGGPIEVKIEPQNVTVEVALEPESFVYTGSAIKPAVTVTVGGTGITTNNYEVSYTNNTDVGTASVTVAAKDGGNYAFESVTKNFTITQAATVITAPTSNAPLTFNNSPQPLVNAGSATFGTILYSLNDGPFSEDIPTETNAGTYNVYYKVEETANYTGAIGGPIEVKIEPQNVTVEVELTSGSFVYTGSAIKPAVTVTVGGTGITTSNYEVSYTDNTNVGTAYVTVKAKEDGNYAFDPKTVSFEIRSDESEPPGGDEGGDEGDNSTGPDALAGIIPASILSDDNPSRAPASTGKNPEGATTTKTEDKATGTVTETTTNPDGSRTVVETKKDGTVTTTETDKDGNKTETEKKADGSSVTKVAQADGATATVSTNAEGKVEAAVALPPEAVSDAQAKGEAVPLPIPEVKATRSAETAPVVTVSTGSQDEVMVEIPTANVAPGTVAVIVKADGTEEVIKTSMPTENGVAVSLPDGATVKIVDNSKDFADVPAESWEADAVAFASARELFTGTSETTFAPEAPMTRAMMMTVLARFDGTDTTGGSTWYEKGQEWAVANGVSDGKNPNGNITREQLAVMLWRYSGSPSPSGDLDEFSDADSVSGFARDAVRWAAEKGILSGTGDGQLEPGGLTTRVQAAQMLKNFMENL